MENSFLINPTATIDLNFGHYLASREEELSSHLVGGIPDYAFSLDQKLRQQLMAMGPVRAIARSLVSYLVPLNKQLFQMKGVAVGPNQYPEIYKIGEDCARQLGIGVPQIFIEYSPIINGYTYATDDITPMIVLSSALVEAMEPAELRFVIGHECGHIHNLHGVYNTAVELITNPLAGIILHSIPGGETLKMILKGSILLFFLSWNRCAEVTCDRAGLICCGDVSTAQMALAKLVTGGTNRLKDINLEQFIEQIAKIQSTPVKLFEFFQSHPIIPKRIATINLFAHCEVFYSWSPELRSTASSIRTKEETDDLCEQIIRIISQESQPDSNNSARVIPKKIEIE